jgi:competence protein ComEC
VLVDTGEPAADVVRLLRREGVARIDLLVITHAHLDHIGGAPSVLDALPVDVIWMRPVPADVTVVPQYVATLERAILAGIPVRAPPEGAQVLLGDLQLEVLGPPPGRPYLGVGSELNNGSIVLRASVRGAGSVLLAGDVEQAAQQHLLAAYGGRLRADVLIVPHHGSRTTDPAFLAAVAAPTAIISVGSGNRHGHPHADTLRALERLGATVRRTDREGTVRIAVTGEAPASAGAGGPGTVREADRWNG